MIIRATQGIDVSPETLALETVQDIGPKGSFLSDRHTLTYMREEYFLPKFAYRSRAAAKQAADQQTVVNVARDIADSLIKSHQPVPLPEESVLEIQRIVDKATASLTRT
jgi:trimethylamine--corrinoid protein Co-methyltransferase